jgi:hypothetical protein
MDVVGGNGDMRKVLTWAVILVVFSLVTEPTISLASFAHSPSR